MEPLLLQSLLDFILAAKLPQFALLLCSAFPGPVESEVRRRAWEKASTSELLRRGSAKRMWYFARLELYPIKFNLTVRKPLAKAHATTTIRPLGTSPALPPLPPPNLFAASRFLQPTRINSLI